MAKNLEVRIIWRAWLQVYTSIHNGDHKQYSLHWRSFVAHLFVFIPRTQTLFLSNLFTKWDLIDQSRTTTSLPLVPNFLPHYHAIQNQRTEICCSWFEMPGKNKGNFCITGKVKKEMQLQANLLASIGWSNTFFSQVLHFWANRILFL